MEQITENFKSTIGTLASLGQLGNQKDLVSIANKAIRKSKIIQNFRKGQTSKFQEYLNSVKNGLHVEPNTFYSSQGSYTMNKDGSTEKTLQLKDLVKPKKSVNRDTARRNEEAYENEMTGTRSAR